MNQERDPMFFMRSTFENLRAETNAMIELVAEKRVRLRGRASAHPF